MMYAVLLTLLTVALLYWFLVRPVLRKTPSLATLFAREETAWAAIKVKFTGIRQQLASALMVVASVVVEMYDHVAPQLTGIDTSSLTKDIPAWVWPLVSVGGVLLLQYFRTLADKAHEAEIAALKADK